MTTNGATKRERLAAREEAILAAATDAFLKGGMRAAKMADIARAADVAEGTLYLYYKNKEALFAAVVARHWRDLTAGAIEAVAKSDTPTEQIFALCRYTLGRIMDDWKLFELTFFLQYGSQGEEDATDRQSYVQVFDAIIERGRDRGDFAPQFPPRMLRDLFFGSLDYAARSMLRRNERSQEDEAARMVGAALLAVVQAPGSDFREAPSAINETAARLEAVAERMERTLTRLS